MAFNSGFNPFKRRAKTETSAEKGLKSFFLGKTEGGDTLEIKEATDDSLELKEKVRVFINNVLLQVTSAKQLRDGGTTIIRGILPSGEEHEIYIPSPIKRTEVPTLNHEPLTRGK